MHSYTDELFLDMLKIETNRYTRECFENARVSNASRTVDWKKSTVSELGAFITVLLEMGITRRPTLLNF
ncbi:hypothetical protein WN48_08002 [Eufriesea mexicana]|nr:hypothetical protein WN48_08002 [Eufriesea mexicana]